MSHPEDDAALGSGIYGWLSVQSFMDKPPNLNSSYEIEHRNCRVPINMPSLLYFASFFSIIAIINAQCVDPGFIPCYPAGSQLGGVPSDSFDDSGFWDSLQDVASLPIGRRDLANRLAARQEALCCSPDPDVECLVTNDEDIPFCYVCLII